MFQVLLFEGIPGSGKTTLAKRVRAYLDARGVKTRIVHEGDIHPIDLAWCSYMDEEDFKELIEKYKDLQEEIRNHTEKKGDKYITAYTKVRIKDRKDIGFYQDFSNHEIYKFDNLEDFKNIHLDLYAHFNKHCKKEDAYIFECVLLQNHLNELILRYGKKEAYIREYIQELLDQLKDINLQIIHLQQKEVDQQLAKIIEERTPETMNIPKKWVDLVVDYLDRQPFAKELGYEGEQGVYEYYKDRQELEKKLIKKLDANIASFTVDENYDQVFQEIVDHLEKHWLE
jgi:hypothetical protein